MLFRSVLARREIARLKAGTKLPVVELQEFAHATDLIAGLTDALQREVLAGAK